MPYDAEISRDNPTCFLFLIDQSRSMQDEISAGDGTQAKANGVADSINCWLQELSIKCAKVEGVRDYYHVGVIGYGKDVGPGFVGEIAGRDLVPISEIAESPARLENRTKKIPDGTGGLVEQTIKIPVWFDPKAEGGTPMCRAAGEGQRVIVDWLKAHPDCFPPILIHITDGEATDGNPQSRLAALRQLRSSDGSVMLFNIHLSANPDATPITFPDSADQLPDAYSKMLFETASPLTPTMRALAKEHGIETSDNSRAFVLNADMVLLVQAIDIGTRPANLNPVDSAPAAVDTASLAAAAAGPDADEAEDVLASAEADAADADDVLAAASVEAGDDNEDATATEGGYADADDDSAVGSCADADDDVSEVGFADTAAAGGDDDEERPYVPATGSDEDDEDALYRGGDEER